MYEIVYLLYLLIIKTMVNFISLFFCRIDMTTERDLQGEGGGGIDETHDNYAYTNRGLSVSSNSIAETVAIDVKGSDHFTGEL